MTIGNCVGWAATALIGYSARPHGLGGVGERIVGMVALIISMPVALPFWRPTFARGRSLDGVTGWRGALTRL